MANMDGRLKVKVLLAQALFGNPDILMMDEPTNNLDINVHQLAGGLPAGLDGTVIVVSHDRHFLNTICTHIVDIDYNKIKMYVGNYDFWYESTQLVQNLMKNQNKRNEEKIKELQAFICPLLRQQVQEQAGHGPPEAAGQADRGGDARLLPPLPLGGLSARPGGGQDILFVTDVSKTIDGVKVLDNVSFSVEHDDKIALVGDNELAQTTLFKILMGEMEPDEGTVKWGVTASQSYFPKDNTDYFQGRDHGAGGLASPVPGQEGRGLPARLPGPDAVLRRGCVQAGEGPLRRREGPVHALQDDAVRRQCAPWTSPPTTWTWSPSRR